MGFNPYIGWTEAELVVLLRGMQEEHARGSQIVGSGSGDVNASFMAQRPAKERMGEVMMALHRLNPDDYPLHEVTRVLRTFAVIGRPI